MITSYEFIGSLLVIGNLLITVAVVRSPSYERTQKVFQVLLMWLLPVLGGIICWYMLREDSHSAFSGSGGDNENVWLNFPDPHEGHNHNNHHPSHGDAGSTGNG